MSVRQSDPVERLPGPGTSGPPRGLAAWGEAKVIAAAGLALVVCMVFLFDAADLLAWLISGE